MGERPRHEVAEIFQRYQRSVPQGRCRSWSWEQSAVVRRITACRTARLGGHVEECDACGHQRVSYNSCRNRHCPKCQGSAQAAWLEARQADVLPVPYAHVVFTIPQRLAPLALQNPTLVYALLLRTSAHTLQEIALNPKHLGARLGFFAILHTWGQTLVHHPHVHCVVPAGGLAEDGTWRACRPGFFLPVRVLSRLFRGKFLAGLRDAFREGRLELHGGLARYRGSEAFEGLLLESLRTEWVVYAKPAVRSPRACARLPRPLYPQDRDLEPSAAPRGRRGRRLPLQGLPKPASPLACSSSRRVHAPLPAPRSPQGLRAHPTLRVPRQCQQRSPALVLP